MRTFLTAAFIVAFWCAFWFMVGIATAHDAEPSPAAPQGWRYGWECCSANDCARVGSHHVTEGPEGVTVRLSAADHPMLLWDVEETIPYGSSKLKYESKDDFIHVCHDRQFVKPDGSHYTGRIICVYLPPRSF